MSSDDSAQVDALKEKGKQHFQSGAFEEASKCYEAALQLEPQDHVLHNNLAMCAIKLRWWPVAMDHADRALFLTAGNNAKAWYRRGLVFLETDMCALAAFYDFKQA